MSNTDTILFIVATSLLSLVFLAWIILTIAAVKLINSLRRMVEKAEEVVDSVETATEIFKDTEGRLALFKLIRNIIKLAKKRSK